MDFQYPIGKFQPLDKVSSVQLEEWINQIAEAPTELQSAINGLSIEQLDTPYRTGGWTIRQIVHHLAENDILAYTRFKFALTEECPQIRPALEDLWAELPDCNLPIDSSLQLFQLIHERWIALISGLKTDDFSRTYVHPVSGVWRLDKALGLYSWHNRHHTAQILSFRERVGW